jgi:hypothetical protein
MSEIGEGSDIVKIYCKIVVEARKKTPIPQSVSVHHWLRRLWQCEEKYLQVLRELRPCTCVIGEDKICCTDCLTLPSDSELVISVFKRALNEIMFIASSWPEHVRVSRPPSESSQSHYAHQMIIPISLYNLIQSHPERQ